METKICKGCKQTKSLDDFYYHKSPKDKRVGKCKICSCKEKALYQKNNPDKMRIKMRRWLFKKRRAQTDDPEVIKKMNREKYLRITYNLTLEKHNDLFVKQEGKCAICKRNYTEFKKSLSVDHDHATGKVRGLLCYNCNVGLGQFKDKVELLTEAILYLNQST